MLSDNLVYQKDLFRRYFVPIFLVVITVFTLHGYIISLNAFVSPSQELRWDGMIDYINKQHEHHTRKSFQEEYIGLLEEYSVEFDDDHVWG